MNCTGAKLAIFHQVLSFHDIFMGFIASNSQSLHVSIEAIFSKFKLNERLTVIPADDCLSI